MKTLFTLLAFLIVNSLALATTKVMSFNIKYDNGSFNAEESWNYWLNNTNDRRDRVVSVINAYGPDILGVQEMLDGQKNYLSSQLSGYGYYGVGRDNGVNSGERSGIFYKTSKYTLTGQGEFWLSSTPNTAGTTFSTVDSSPRITTWVKLQDTSSGETIFVMNTHWTYTNADGARDSGAQLMRDKMNELSGGLPVIVLGDLNESITGNGYKELIGVNAPSERQLADSISLSGEADGKTYHNWAGDPTPPSGNRIDHILHSAGDFSVTAGDIVRTQFSGHEYSDHFAVTATLVAINPPEIQSFSTSSSVVPAGETVTLSWASTAATSLNIDQGVGAVTGLTSQDVVVASNTTYTLTASNTDGNDTASVTVIVGDTLEAESATFSGGATNNQGSGWSGSGYIDITEGDHVEFTYTAAATGTYDIELRTTGNATGMALKLVVNDAIVENALAVPNTGSWDSNWTTTHVSNIFLNAGSNTIRLTDNGSDQPQIDRIVVGLNSQFEALDTNLVSHWKLDEATGSTAFETAGSNAHGTLVGGATWNNENGIGHLSLDGADDGISLTSAAALAGSGDFGVSLWVKNTSTTGGYLVQQRDSSATGYNGEYVISQLADGKVNFFIHNSGFQFNFSSTASVNDGAWHHILAVRNGSNGYIYIDGNLSGQATGPIKELVLLGVSIGYDRRDNGSYYDGLIDDVRIYNRALSADDANAMMANSAPAISDATFAITENEPLAFSVGAVVMSDANGGGQHTFSITAGDPTGVFSINNSGQITTAGIVDYETSTQYILTVSVSDSGVPVFSDTATVTVNVSDIVSDDSDSDGIDDVWEVTTFGNTTTANAMSDNDNDGQNDVSEYQSGTDPNDLNDLLEITELLPTSSNATVKWASKSGKSYEIEYSYNLNDWFDVVTGQVSSADGEKTYVDSDAARTAAPKVFYRVVVE